MMTCKALALTLSIVGTGARAPEPEGSVPDPVEPTEATRAATGPTEVSHDAHAAGGAKPSAAEPEAAGPTPTTAAGSRTFAPLPPPPPAEDPRTVEHGPWRGRFWIDLRFDLTAPLGGESPAEGNVISGGGTFLFGWRIRNIVGVYTAIESLVHDSVDRTVEDAYGGEYRVRDLGELTVFDHAVARVFLPVTGRFQPYLDAGGGTALLASAVREDVLVGWHTRAGLGFDGWVGHSFTLGVSVAHRLLGIDRTLGHSLQTSAVVGVHW
jgi:hypothetical protein